MLSDICVYGKTSYENKSSPSQKDRLLCYSVTPKRPNGVGCAENKAVSIERIVAHARFAAVFA